MLHYNNAKQHQQLKQASQHHNKQSCIRQGVSAFLRLNTAHSCLLQQSRSIPLYTFPSVSKGNGLNTENLTKNKTKAEITDLAHQCSRKNRDKSQDLEHFETMKLGILSLPNFLRK